MREAQEFIGNCYDSFLCRCMSKLFDIDGHERVSKFILTKNKINVYIQIHIIP